MSRWLLPFLLLAFPAAANAALLGRLPVDPENEYPQTGDFRAWYDTRLDITWLDDADYAMTSGFSPDGRMTWVEAQGWIASLNAAEYLGVSSWRLPVALPVDEMSDLYFGTLGGYCPPVSNCLLPTTAPFDNLIMFDYWTGTLQFGGTFAADFYFGGGWAGNGSVTTSRKHVWLVTDGDVATVPVPGAAWLYLSAIGVLTALRRADGRRSGRAAHRLQEQP